MARNDDLTFRCLAVDPGTEYVGWCVFEINPRAKTGKLGDMDCFHASPKHSWEIRAADLAAMVGNIAVTHEVRTAIIELPRAYVSAGGKGEAASNSSALIKLGVAVGMISGEISARLGGPMHVTIDLVPVQTWKGQVPKSVTQSRLKDRWGLDTSVGRHDQWDAVGMADWFIRKKYGFRPLVNR